jgi:hypothetical protein
MLPPIAFAVLLSVSIGLPLTAQLSEAQPGARVRVMAPGIVAGKYEGTILTRTADTIVVGGPNAVPMRIPFARIASLEISRGKSRADGAIAGIKWGAPIMAATGAALAIAASSNDARCASCDPINIDDGIAVTVVFALTGAIYGAGIGALIGRERWDAFDLAPQTSLRIERGRIGVGLQVGF